MNKEPFDASQELHDLLSSALLVIRETIRADYSLVDEEGEKKPWPAHSLSTAIWLIEKITGKAKTEDMKNTDGLLRQVLKELSDRKAAVVAANMGKQDTFIADAHEIDDDLDDIDKFVKDFGE